MTFVFAGGGTGGHLFPGLAVAEQLRARMPGAEIVFVGSDRGVERQIVKQYKYRHVSLPVEPSTTLRRNPVRFFWKNWQARSQALALLNQLHPAAVIGLGGFASVPVVLAARSCTIPALLLEQNIVPGRATRWLHSGAALVCVSFDQTVGSLNSRANTRTTGNPVGQQIASLDQRSPARDHALPPTLLILGGSQGATAVNELAIGAIERLLHANPEIASTSVTDVVPVSDWTIMHQTGLNQHDECAARYSTLGLAAETAPFFNDMPRRYAQATLAISRGGATSLAELAVAGVPSIIVPYPNSIGDHQLLNARFYADSGAARIVEQSSDSISAMTKALSEIAFDRNCLHSMSEAMSSLANPHAAEAVAEEIERFAETRLNHRKSA